MDKECIHQEDGEAFFADNGHAGMIKKDIRISISLISRQEESGG